MREELTFIEKRLFWNRAVNRSDLIRKFRVSESTAARILRVYRQMCPENIVDKRGQGGYVAASENFKPRFYMPDVKDSGLILWRLGEEFAKALNERNIRIMDDVAAAVTGRHLLRMEYVNRSGVRTTRKIVPVGFITIFDKPVILYAYCLLRESYRSFDLHRIITLEKTDEHLVTKMPEMKEAKTIDIEFLGGKLSIPEFCIYPLAQMLIAEGFLNATAKTGVEEMAAKLKDTRSVAKATDGELAVNL